VSIKFREFVFRERIAKNVERIKELEEELKGRECYGEWCGKSPRKNSSGLCQACEWKASYTE
jgi:hypothetical protein